MHSLHEPWDRAAGNGAWSRFDGIGEIKRQTAWSTTFQAPDAYQAEIDSACELIDFLRFNVYFAQQIYKETIVDLVQAANRPRWRGEARIAEVRERNRLARIGA